LRRTSRWGTN